MAKAIVKASAGKQQRAAFAIEDAIADTRQRIAASAGANLKEKAHALAKPNDAYKFGGATARNLLRFACDGIKPAKGFDRMVSDVHALLKGEAGERGRDGLCDGLVYLTQADYSSEGKSKAKARGPRLQTERDGRIFAVDVLERLKNADANKATAYPYSRDATDYGSDEIKPYRKGPQWDGFYRDLSHLQIGTVGARKGFASIFTDCLGDDIGFNLDVYRELEAKTLFQDFGTPGTKYQAPKREAQAKPIKKAEKAEKPRGPLLQSGEAEAIESFIQNSGQARLAAMAFLSRPYAEIAKTIKADRKAAVAFAAVAMALQSCEQNYMKIILNMLTAKREIVKAIEARKDGRLLLLKAEGEQVAHDKRQMAK